MKTSPFSRRRFLKGLGVGGALVPLLDAEWAWSAAAPFPKRCIFVVTPNGVLQNLYWPSGNQTAWSFPLGTDRVPGITAPLNDVKADLLVIKGINMKSAHEDGSVKGAHDNFTHILTGKNGGVSIDQVLATRLNPPTKFKFLTLAVMVQWSALYQARVSWAGGGRPVTPQEDPYKVYTDLFSGGVPGGDPAQRQALERLLLAKRSVLDVVGRDLMRYQARLGSEDRVKLDSHMEGIRELERKFDPKFAGGSGCAVPTQAGTKVDVQSVPNYPRVGELQMDMIVEAMACDLTRIATLQWSNAAANHLVFSWLGKEFTEGAHKDGAGRPEFNALHNHHEISHHGTEYEGALKSKVENWYHKQLLYLINKLRSKREGAGTMLDNTLVLWANNMHDGGAHSHGPHLPWLLAGRAGGLKTGRYLDMGAAPIPHNRLLMSLCQAMDAPVDSFGDPKYCTGGVISQLFG